MLSFSRQELTAKVGRTELLVSLSEQERLFGSMGEPYLALALAYNAIGREWEAEKWAMKATDELLLSEGPKDEKVREAMGLSREPRAHWSWPRTQA